MALQKVYAAELFFFGQSFKICRDTRGVNALSSRPPSLPPTAFFQAPSVAIYQTALQMEGKDEAHPMSPTMPPAVI